MPSYLTDECVDGRLIEGLLEHEPALDLVRVQDVGLQSADDRVVLARAADEGRIVITDDRSTLSGFAYERVAAGQSMPGGDRPEQDDVPRRHHRATADDRRPLVGRGTRRQGPFHHSGPPSNCLPSTCQN